jgi:hypothetical protein
VPVSACPSDPGAVCADGNFDPLGLWGVSPRDLSPLGPSELDANPRISVLGAGPSPHDAPGGVVFSFIDQTPVVMASPPNAASSCSLPPLPSQSCTVAHEGQPQKNNKIQRAVAETQEKSNQDYICLERPSKTDYVGDVRYVPTLAPRAPEAVADSRPMKPHAAIRNVPNDDGEPMPTRCDYGKCVKTVEHHVPHIIRMGLRIVTWNTTALYNCCRRSSPTTAYSFAPAPFSC